MPVEQSWRILLQKDVQEFIQKHEREDVASLALQKMPDTSWHAPIILDQIKARQKARLKCKNLYDTDGFIFPSSNILEQASSSQCAFYKASLTKGKSFADLTAGCGVDAFHIARNFELVTLVEKDRLNAEILAHNASILDLQANMTIECADAGEVIRELPQQDVIFVDPQRRSTNKRGLYKLEDCSPNIFSMLDVLKEKTKSILLKTSPILDIKKAVQNLPMVHEVHVVQWQNECKEVVYNFDPKSDPSPFDGVKINAVILDDAGSVHQKLQFTPLEEHQAQVDYALPQKYIFEPEPVLLKAGCFNLLGEKYSLAKLHPNSHLYTSKTRAPELPGRFFEILDVIPAKTKFLDINKAEVAVRNYPSTPEDLRKKLKIKEGSHYRIFATTLLNDQRKLVICKK
ncbi:MAG: hypothetical protein GC137_08250 [Alphaproteobacteria bacterium]|nr:hypothetical protein [Alphaproteobacteria bacterium]